jgi:outer membrane murein-binding lipoprotein Lpp
MTGWNLRTVAAVAVAGGLAAGGCAKHMGHISRPAPQSTLAMDDTAQRLSDLQRDTDQLNTDSQRLPGKSSAEHRTIMLDVLADYGKVLPLLSGPRSGLVFREQVETVNGAREQLAGESPDLSAEPAIDNGLRATERALSDLATAEVFASAQLTSTFDTLNAKLNELDNVHGPLHQVTVSDAVGQINKIIDQMSQILIERLTPPPTPPASEPATEPTTESATEPATQPATEPATQPATEPDTAAPMTMPAAAPASMPAATMPETMPATTQAAS